MEKIEIFDMTLADFVEIEDVLIEEFDDFWSPSMLKSELVGDNKKYIVAKIGEKITGFAGILIMEPELEIMNIVVRKSERKKGVGTVLLQKIIDIARQGNFQNIFLEVNEKNLGAIKLYEKAGFERIGLRKKYYNGTDDSIIMSKK